MPRKKKRDHDFSVNAFRVVQEATGQSEVESGTKIRAAKKKRNFDAKSLGRLGGLKGGKARAGKLTPERRSEIAKTAAQARWAKSS